MALLTRDEHIQWAKKRAHEYLDRGDLNEAVTSMLSDLQKHPETKGIGEKMSYFGMMLLMNRSGARDVRRFIDGFAE